MTESTLRLTVFLALLLVFIGIETLVPRRGRVEPRPRRWMTNFLMSAINTLILRLLSPITAVSAAIWAANNSWGILNMIDLPVWMSVVTGFLILDLAIYLQHWITHRIPLLWRLHKVHHADRDFDVTTAIRFHPIEIALSMIYKCAIIVLLGPAAWLVILFEMVLNGTALFNHANIKLPLGLDRGLRLVLVTPDMHRVHHSIRPAETHSNFGFNLSIWDRLFGTYNAQPEAGHEGMTIGLPQYQSRHPSDLIWNLVLPFKPTRTENQKDTI